MAGEHISQRINKSTPNTELNPLSKIAVKASV